MSAQKNQGLALDSRKHQSPRHSPLRYRGSVFADIKTIVATHSGVDVLFVYYGW